MKIIKSLVAASITAAALSPSFAGTLDHFHGHKFFKPHGEAWEPASQLTRTYPDGRTVDLARAVLKNEDGNVIADQVSVREEGGDMPLCREGATVVKKTDMSCQTLRTRIDVNGNAWLEAAVRWELPLGGVREQRVSVPAVDGMQRADFLRWSLYFMQAAHNGDLHVIGSPIAAMQP